MSWHQIRVADALSAQPGIDPLVGNSSSEVPLPLTGVNLLAQVVDTGLVPMLSRIKTLAIVVTTAVTSSGAQQFVIQLFAARSPFGVLGSTGAVMSSGATSQPSAPFNGASGAASQIPTSGSNAAQLVGPSVNWSSSGTSIPIGIYWFSSTSPGSPSANPPTSMTELTQEYPCIGLEIR